MSQVFSRKKSLLKKYRDKLPLIIGSAAFFTLYISGIIAQFTQVGMLTGKTRISFNPLYCILANFTVSFTGIIVVSFMYACIAGYLYLRYRDKHQIKTEEDERGFNRETSGVYGTSKLLDAEEARDYCEVEPLERTTGLILGRFEQNQVISIPPDGKRIKKNEFGQPVREIDPETGEARFAREPLKTNGNRHCVVTGASGSGKSYCYARPAIFQSIQQGESVIVTDPKGELFSDTSEYARQHGYTVKIFNLMSPENSDSWDALAELKTATQIGIETQTFISIIMANTTNPNGGGDEVYVNGEQNLLTALALYVLTAQSYVGPKTLGAVYDLLGKDPEELDRMFSVLPSGSIALRPWSIFKSASQALRGNLVLGAGTRLQVLQDDVIKAITGTPDIDLTLPGKSKCAYYIIIPDMNSTFEFVSSLFFSCLFNKLVEYSRRQPNGRLPVPINVIMDEFIAIGKLPDFDKKLATVRSAGINISMIFQTLAQLQNQYPDGLWESLLANCYTYLCLSCNDMTTAEYISKRSGLTTVALENIRIDRPFLNIGNIPSSVSHSYSVGERAVMQPAEIIGLAGENKIIVSLLGSDLIVANKFPYTEMVDISKLVLVNMYNHAPAWRIRYQYQANTYAEPVAPVTYSYQKKYTDVAPQERAHGPEDGEAPPTTNAGQRFGRGADPISSTDGHPRPMRPPLEEDDDFAPALTDTPPEPTAQQKKPKRGGFTRIVSNDYADDF